MATETNPAYRVDPAELPGEAVIFGSTAAMRAIRDRIDSVLASDLPVLIQGESGTGKEVTARFLHSRSCRHNAPFARINCAAVPAMLLEAELFGCEKGFLEATAEARPGLIERAEGGTLLLDEIDSIHWELQGGLLELLRGGLYARMGGSQKREANIRIIGATNMDLRERVSLGLFRQDLFHRIDVVSLRLSALRDRKGDIPQLCEYLLQKLSRQFGRRPPRLRADTLRLLKQRDWPGNVRELENWIARAVILGDDLDLRAEFAHRETDAAGFDARIERPLVLQSNRRRTAFLTSTTILKVLQANHGNRRKTAEELKISYRLLLSRLREAGMPPRRRTHRGQPPVC